MDENEKPDVMQMHDVKLDVVGNTPPGDRDTVFLLFNGETRDREPWREMFAFNSYAELWHHMQMTKSGGPR